MESAWTACEDSVEEISSVSPATSGRGRADAVNRLAAHNSRAIRCRLRIGTGMSRFEPTTAGQCIKPLRTAKRHKYAPACKQYVGGNPATETNQPKDRRCAGSSGGSRTAITYSPGRGGIAAKLPGPMIHPAGEHAPACMFTGRTGLVSDTLPDQREPCC